MGNTFDAGITPAYAGKSLDQIANDIAVLGSPPRMRGKEPIPLCTTRTVGITPAYAGKSAGPPFGLWCCRDHPRVCGEKGYQTQALISFWGSPPRMRGKVDFVPVPIQHLGITPAYAGKRPRRRSRWWAWGDHPRVCGEKSSSRYVLSITLGSPPRMRGKVSLSPLRCVRGWITPAYAGKSSLGLSWCYVYRDHPRVCGEKPRMGCGH